jgi:hypothetical protein
MSQVWTFLTKPIFKFPVWFGPAILTFGISAYVGYRGALIITYRHQELEQFSSLSPGGGRDLRNRVQILNELEIPAFLSQTDNQQTRKQIQLTEQLRKTAPAELAELIDFERATDELILASAEQPNKSSDTPSHIASAGKLLKALGWTDVSDQALMAYAQHEAQLRPRTRRK